MRVCVCVLQTTDVLQELALAQELAVSRPLPASGQLLLAWRTAGTGHTPTQTHKHSHTYVSLSHTHYCHKSSQSLSKTLEAGEQSLLENQDVFQSTVGRTI